MVPTPATPDKVTVEDATVATPAGLTTAYSTASPLEAVPPRANGASDVSFCPTGGRVMDWDDPAMLETFHIQKQSKVSSAWIVAGLQAERRIFHADVSCGWKIFGVSLYFFHVQRRTCLSR